MLERKSPLSQHRILGRFGVNTEEPGITIREIKEFRYLEISYWDGAATPLKSKFLELLTLSDFPEAGKSVALKDGTLLRPGPGLLAYYGGPAPEDILRAMISAGEGSVVSLSHSRCALRLSGPKVRDVLKRGLRINMSEDAFPEGANAYSEIHGLSVLLIRQGKAEYDLLFARSTAPNIWTWLTETAAQFGYEVL
ncbi:MAG: hypothetical protein COB93_11980 [Sneathiella sp.]|nr:MAG: hypothetical protein COB93_11980 [Sneathiella sp.]